MREILARQLKNPDVQNMNGATRSTRFPLEGNAKAAYECAQQNPLGNARSHFEGNPLIGRPVDFYNPIAENGGMLYDFVEWNGEYRRFAYQFPDESLLDVWDFYLARAGKDPRSYNAEGWQVNE